MTRGTAGRSAAPQGGTVDPEEVARFNALAQSWWDPRGDFRPLHTLNPVRLAYIRDRIVLHFGHDPLASRPLAGLSVLDIGCGGGLLAEPLARLGADMTGIDAGDVSIRIAQAHARESGLEIDYRHARAEDLAAAGERFDVVLAMEVVEHVTDLGAFLKASCALVRPGGGMVIATLNRTPKAFALAIVGVEYVLRWLPRGTHRWNRFVRPSELADGLRRNGLDLAEITGVTYDPLADKWRLSDDLAVNYMVYATRPGGSRGAAAGQESR